MTRNPTSETIGMSTSRGHRRVSFDGFKLSNCERACDKCSADSDDGHIDEWGSGSEEKRDLGRNMAESGVYIVEG
jgi:hypothetical protein